MNKGFLSSMVWFCAYAHYFLNGNEHKKDHQRNAGGPLTKITTTHIVAPLQDFGLPLLCCDNLLSGRL